MKNLFLPILLLLLSTPPTVSRRQKARENNGDYSHYPGHGHAPPQVTHSSDCLASCNKIESETLNLRTPCNKYRRQSPEVGLVCSESLLKAYKQVCLPACKLEDIQKFPLPKVAKCTGIGSPGKILACEAGFFAGVTQTVTALGVDLKKKAEEEEKAREREEWEEKEKVEKERLVKAREVELKRIKEVKETHELGGVTEHEKGGVYHDESAGKSDVLLESEKRAHELVEEASERAHQRSEAVGKNVKHYVHFNYDDGDRIMAVKEGEDVAELVTAFCRHEIKKELGGCVREVLMLLKMTHKELKL